MFVLFFIILIKHLSDSLIRGIRIASGRRALGTVAATKLQNIELESYRTFESHPPNHNESHLGRVYTVPADVQKLLQNDIPNEWKQQIKVFVEFGILIRKPAVEIISYLEKTDYSKPINKYVLCILFSYISSLIMI